MFDIQRSSKLNIWNVKASERGSYTGDFDQVLATFEMHDELFITLLPLAVRGHGFKVNSTGEIQVLIQQPNLASIRNDLIASAAWAKCLNPHSKRRSPESQKNSTLIAYSWPVFDYVYDCDTEKNQLFRLSLQLWLKEFISLPLTASSTNSPRLFPEYLHIRHL